MRVVHCAAWTAVDACESDADRAWLANALAVRYVADACRRADAHLVHMSTDYVFSGAKPTPYTEWDPPDPLSTYGRSKLGGEYEALSAGIGATVVRTSWVCGEFGANMVKTILRLAGEQPQELAFVDDQIGHPSFCADLAPVLRRLAVDRRPGVFHVTNQGAVSWYEFAHAVVEASGRDPDMVRPISTTDMPAAAPRATPREQRAGQCGVAPRRPAAAPGLPRTAGGTRRPDQLTGSVGPWAPCCVAMFRRCTTPWACCATSSPSTR